MKSLLRRIFLVGAAIFVVAQAFRPDRTNPAADPALSVRNDTSLSPQLLDRLERSCVDCHSYQTTWPWYSAVTPVNYLMVRDVNGGRSHLNLSLWMSLKPGRRASLLGMMADEVEDSSMPLQPYTLLHASASMTPEDRIAFVEWAHAAQDSIMAARERSR